MALLPHAIETTLERFRELLKQRFGLRVQELKLFGSWARGQADEESDVDVFVSIAGLTEAERQEVLELAFHADAPNDWLVLLSPLAYSTERAAHMRESGRRLFRDIDAEGVPL